MRQNLPITNEEYVLPDDEVIITHTDVESRITYANHAFVRSSGFSLEECIGQPQNIVRHPDMPATAFADLWRTIRAGTPWTGIVKNRRKDGGFYWVRANITPIVENGKLAGFMSVRVKPTAQEIHDAEALYKALRSGHSPHLRVRYGKAYDASFRGVVRRLLKPSLSGGTWLAVGTMTLLFATIFVLSLWGGDRAVAWIKWLSMGGAALAFANLVYVQSRVVQPLRRWAVVAARITSGDSRSRFAEDGDPLLADVGRTLNQMRLKLDGVLKDTREAVDAMLDGAQEVVAANSSLSGRTNERAAGIEETAASLEQLTAAVARNTENAHNANVIATGAARATDDGRHVVSKVVGTMQDIESSSKRIGNIVALIDDIAFQTNLLALNAAVEAARAGEQGRGFAVVAQEVRNLAQRSATAAKEIRDLILQSNDTVAGGMQLATQAADAMAKVVSAVQQVGAAIAEIESASREQSAGIEQINKAMMQMDEITQKDAGMAQELSVTAQQLESRSRQVLQAVSTFSLRIESGVADSEHRGAKTAKLRRAA